MRILLLLLSPILFTFLVASSVDTKIKKSKNSLKKTQLQQNQISYQLLNIAKSIENRRVELMEMERILDDLAVEQNRSMDRYIKTKEILDNFEEEIEKLDEIIKEKERTFQKLLQEQFATVVAIEELNSTTKNSVFMREFYEASKKANDEELAKLKYVIKHSSQRKKELQRDTIALRLNIANLENKRQIYLKKKRKVEQTLEKLKRDEAKYRKRLSLIITKQSELIKTLAELNILKKDEVAKAQMLEAIKKAQLRKRAKAIDNLRKRRAKARQEARVKGKKVKYNPVTVKNIHIKQKGASYQKSLIRKYRGAKTIPPIENPILVRKFGTYFDPIYHIRNFNDSVILKSRKKGAKVRSVLNGKVIYVGETPVFGKTVVIQHANHLHTIYSHLAGVSPLIETGKRIPKGTVIGVIKRKLVFRATQKSKIINPLKLIRVR